MPTWSTEDIKRELKQYRHIMSELNELQIEIEKLEECDDDIEAATFNTSSDGMPRGNTTSDPTARLAQGLPDMRRLADMRKQVRNLERRIRRMDAWLRRLTYREQFVVYAFHVDGMKWPEVRVSYNSKSTDEKHREMRTLQRWEQHAIQFLARISR